ncbi:MAG: DUF5050 domain-containing protein [Oscillospiraceae bacterium]|nr:DUF5050 domain-containing protein [Oscillospiraceae bacterium]
MKLRKLLSVILCVFVLGFASSCNVEEQEKQYGNLPTSNDRSVGRAVELDGYLYYGEQYLSKVKLDGSERTRYQKDWSSIYWLNAYKDWIYCTLTFESNPEKDGIYRISKDLSKCELIKSGDMSSMLIYGDDIYYIFNGSLCRCKVDGSEAAVILDKTGNFQPYGDWIYLTIRDPERPLAYPKLYKVKSDGTGFELFLDAEMLGFYICDNKVFYSDSLDSNNLYRMDLDTKDKEKLIDDNVNSFFYKDNNIYYRNSDDLYAYSLENGTSVKISQTFVWQELIAGDYLYFQTSVQAPTVDRICIKDGVIGEQTVFMSNLFDPNDF